MNGRASPSEEGKLESNFASGAAPDTTIPQEFHEDFDEANGGHHLDKGGIPHRPPRFRGEEYQATLRNALAMAASATGLSARPSSECTPEEDGTSIEQIRAVVVPPTMGEEEEGPEGVTLEVDEETCEDIVTSLVDAGIVSWSEIAEEILQGLQPPQTATHVPQLDGIRDLYESGDRWAPSRRWMLAQFGLCEECGNILNMTHDHVLGRDLLSSKADYLENLRFLCRRCNQSRHWEKGSILEWGTAAAVQYLILRERPRTVGELGELGKALGLTQSNQRYEEGWALAVHLHERGVYELDEVHPEIEREELDAWERYYSETNEFFSELDGYLRTEYREELRKGENLQILITTRQTKRSDRRAAAAELGLEGDEEIEEIVEKPRRTDQDRRKILNALDLFSVHEINEIVSKGAVSLFHLLNDEEQEAVMSVVTEKLEELRETHLSPYLEEGDLEATII